MPELWLVCVQAAEEVREHLISSWWEQDTGAEQKSGNQKHGPSLSDSCDCDVRSVHAAARFLHSYHIFSST